MKDKKKNVPHVSDGQGAEQIAPKSRMVQRGYVMVRRSADDGSEWFDMQTYTGKAHLTERRAKEDDLNRPDIKRAWPVVRTARVVITEEKRDPARVAPDKYVFEFKGKEKIDD